MKDKAAMLASLLLVVGTTYILSLSSLGQQALSHLHRLPFLLVILACLLICSVYLYPLWLLITLALEWLRKRMN